MIGEEIRALKAIKPAPATFKTDLEPLVNDLKALKLKFKEVTGEDFDPPKEEKPKAAAGAAPATEREGEVYSCRSQSLVNAMSFRTFQERVEQAKAQGCCCRC